MTRVIIGAAVAGVAAAGILFAAPAHADLAPGVYHYRSVMATGATEDVMIRIDDCGPGCISLFNLDNNKNQGQARIQGTQYVLEQFVPQGAMCADGRWVDVFARYTFNLDGTNGLYTLAGPNPCPQPGPVGSSTFTLTPA
jgi:hypothetical protein